VAAFIGCVAGAISIEDYKDGLSVAGFSDVEVVDSKSDLNAYALLDGQSGCCSPAMDESMHGGLRNLIAHTDLNDYAASVKIFAIKPNV